ncbi:hypothetical protein BYT27DRAFT_7255420 [Phlegmacium glaucopus]|nr:hypothetical protein BYT27DRAFT_7255420 [Phlegmacium glaucopus]
MYPPIIPTKTLLRFRVDEIIRAKYHTTRCNAQPNSPKKQKKKILSNLSSAEALDFITASSLFSDPNRIWLVLSLPGHAGLVFGRPGQSGNLTQTSNLCFTGLAFGRPGQSSNLTQTSNLCFTSGAQILVLDFRRTA